MMGIRRWDKLINWEWRIDVNQSPPTNGNSVQYFLGGYCVGRAYTIIALSVSRVVLGAAAVLRNANVDVARN